MGRFFTKHAGKVYTGIFLVFSFFYFYVVNTSISRDIQQYVLYTDSATLHQAFTMPAGIADLMANFVAQFFKYRAVSAFVLTLLCLGLYLITFAITGFLNFSKIPGKIIASLAFLVVLIPLKDYNFPFLYIVEYFLFALLLYLYFAIKTNGYLKVAIKYGFLAFALFYLAGGLALIAFSLSVFIHELKAKEWIKISGLAVWIVIFTALQIIVSSKYIFYANNVQTLLGKEYFNISYKELYYFFVFFSFFPLVFIMNKFFKTKNGQNQELGAEKYGFYAVTLFLVAMFAVFMPVKSDKKTANLIKYYALNKKWDEVLKVAKNKPTDDRISCFYVNMALYHTGTLNKDMFEYNQNWGAYAMYLSYYTEAGTLMENSDLNFQLGHVGASRYWAYEAQTLYENNPIIMQRLAETNIIMGNYSAARSFAEKLKASVIHKDIAEHYEKCIADSNFLKMDNEIMEKRKQMIKVDLFLDKKDPTTELMELIVVDSTNRMAFEYLQAILLLKQDLVQFVQNIQFMHGLGYTELPDIYQQAILAYQTKANVDLGSWLIYNNTKQKFYDYINIINTFKGNLQAAKPELEKNFKNTYWYYMQFNSPLANNREISLEYEE